MGAHTDTQKHTHTHLAHISRTHRWHDFDDDDDGVAAATMRWQQLHIPYVYAIHISSQHNDGVILTHLLCAVPSTLYNYYYYQWPRIHCVLVGPQNRRIGALLPLSIVKTFGLLRGSCIRYNMNNIVTVLRQGGMRRRTTTLRTDWLRQIVVEHYRRISIRNLINKPLKFTQHSGGPPPHSATTCTTCTTDAVSRVEINRASFSIISCQSGGEMKT